MIYSKLVKLIEDNQEELTRRASKELLSREETQCYRSLPVDLLSERIYDVYSRLISWLNKEKRSEDTEKYYTELGKRRFHEGMPMSEVTIAFMLLKRHLWLFIQERQFFDSTYECYQALELNNKVVLFFDRIIYFAAKGYEEELRSSGHDKEGIFSKLLKKK